MYRVLMAFAVRFVPAEPAHRIGFALLRLALAVPAVGDTVARRCAPDPDRAVRVAGIRFPSRLGLAAGFDKDARGVRTLAALGFGFVEVGTVTARAQPGNDRPRMFRLPADRAVINRLGFNNDGADAAARRLHALRRTPAGRALVVGVNIGRSRAAGPEQTVEDYRRSATLLAPYADYVMINISSPNTPGLRDLQAVDRLEPLLVAVRQACDDASPGRRVPLGVKISPDSADADILAVADLAVRLGLDLLAATNTTVARAGLRSSQVESLGAGGLSGPPLAARSREVLRLLRERVGDRIALISVGGIDTPAEAAARVRAGADLVQAYTGLVYGGPAWPSRVARALPG